MNKYEITQRIEQFAPIETAESWDCVGFMVETSKIEVSKIMLCLTPTEDIVCQAREQNCDMIISHHPLFYIPLSWRDIDIYSAHTNLDRAKGGTTDTLIHSLGYKVSEVQDFLRFVDFERGISLDDFSARIKTISPHARLINNKNAKNFNRIAFCAGSGSEFINEAENFGADALVTGDLKFHTALDSNIVVYDIGHFESEILILPVLESLVGKGVEVVFAEEKSPFSLII